MKIYDDLMKRLFNAYLQLGDDDDLQPEFDGELQDVNMPIFLAELFSYRIGSIPGTILRMLPLTIQRITFVEILDCYIAIQENSMVMYEYVPCMQEIFGIDFHQLPVQCNRITQAGKDLLFRTFRRGSSKPSIWSAEWLADKGIDQADLIQKMRSQGAPILDASS